MGFKIPVWSKFWIEQVVFQHVCFRFRPHLWYVYQNEKKFHDVWLFDIFVFNNRLNTEIANDMRTTEKSRLNSVSRDVSACLSSVTETTRSRDKSIHDVGSSMDTSLIPPCISVAGSVCTASLFVFVLFNSRQID